MPQIQVWINHDNEANVAKLVKTLNDAVVSKRAKKLKAFFIFVDKDGASLEPKLVALADKLKTPDVALAYLGPDNEAVGDYKINLDPKVKNTVMLYRMREIKWQHVNLDAAKDAKDLTRAIDELTK